MTLPRRIKVDNSGEITQLMLDIMQLGKNEDLVSQLKQKSRLLKLITCFINASASVIHYENYDERIECIINYNQKNLAKTITINELAELSHLHQNYFIRCFKHKTGFCPHELYRGYAFKTAAKDLCGTPIIYRGPCHNGGN